MIALTVLFPNFIHIRKEENLRERERLTTPGGGYCRYWSKAVQSGVQDYNSSSSSKV